MKAKFGEERVLVFSFFSYLLSFRVTSKTFFFCVCDYLFSTRKRGRAGLVPRISLLPHLRANAKRHIGYNTEACLNNCLNNILKESILCASSFSLGTLRGMVGVRYQVNYVDNSFL